MKISAVIITKNEERNIGRCLESLQGVADEIVIVDSGSTDKTQEICARYVVRFVSQEWLGYGMQKNFANSLAENDMILSLDADEALSERLRESILEIKSRDEEKKTVYKVNRLTNYCGKWIRHCGWYPDAKVRLFNRKFAEWKGEIHETLVYPEDTNAARLKGDLYHYSYYSIEEHIKQADKFTTLTAAAAFERGKKFYFIALLINPEWKFFKDFILKGGFLDGYYGYIVCKISAFATFLKYTKLKELHKQHGK